MARTPTDWLLQADYDLETAEAMFKSERFIYVVFFCHLAIEKGLKGIYHTRQKKMPPKVHNLLYFVEKLELAVPDQLMDSLQRINSASVPTRYPDSFSRIYKDFTRERAHNAIVNTKEILKWIRIESSK